MDPDLVRQQAEAEFEQRNRAPLVRAKDVPLKDTPAVDTVLAAVAEQAAPPPAAIQAPVPALAMPIKPPRWHVHVQAFFSSGALAALAALGAAAWGANQGFSADEQLWLGGGAAALTAVIYGVVLSVSGNNFTPPGSRS
jgi:hypothetical protein